ncbi:MAG: phosphoribosylaminoimidazolesuccinocarboxamide synthase [Candidatus Omnitrophota bacterium]
MGSVKDLEVLEKPTKDKTGRGRFIFSDRYSVFDWGEMPDHITGKGKALCIIGAYFFEKLEEMGIKTHYRGVVEDGIMEVVLLRVLKPPPQGDAYDYSIYRKETGNFLIPLEVIYRNYLPEGSSLLKRLREGKITIESLGLSKMPRPGQKLEKPVVDLSTKLEATDRHLDWEEAGTIANLTEGELADIRRITLLVNDLITKEVDRLGLLHEDGKVEFGFDESRRLLMVDVLGTPDECRFSFNGIPVSKEAARIWYRKTDWFQDVEEAKKRDRVSWKGLVKSTPPSLPPRLAELIAFLYQSFCNELTGRTWFPSPSLKDILSELNSLI